MDFKKSLKIALIYYNTPRLITMQLALDNLKSELERHKQNQQEYDHQLHTLNLTRIKISDNFDLLTRDYQKKLKNLDHKLEALKAQNQGLIRQNALYKVQIDSYQERLIQKQKIITALISQRKDQHQESRQIRSRSSRRQEEDLHVNTQNILQEQQLPVKQIVKDNAESVVHVPPVHHQKKINKVKHPQPPKVQIHETPAIEDKVIEKQENHVVEEKRYPPPPPPKKVLKAPVLNAFKKQAIPQKHQVHQTEQYEQTKENHQVFQHKEQNRIEDNQIESPTEQNNDFLSHFQIHQQITPIQKTKPKIQEKNEVPSNFWDNFESEKNEVKSTQFFSQLAKAEHQDQNNHFQVEESSIDPVDRDTSIFSNQPNYFSEEAEMTKPMPSKMQKKRGNRSQIRAVDPNLFA